MSISVSARRVAVPSSPPAAQALDFPLPPVRLRSLLLLGLMALGVSSAYPRLRAAFDLQSATAAVADYGSCMAGPTGPAQIRDRPEEFSRLVRRRLLGSRPNDVPFAKCAKLARAVTADINAERAHLARAEEFRDYSGQGRALSELGVSAAPLAALATRAWPFVRGGYTQLIKPSLGALEALYLPPPARPSLGRGLPARGGVYKNTWTDGRSYGLALGSGSTLGVFASADHGVSFGAIAATEGLLEAHAEHCASVDGQRIYRVTPSEDGEFQQVLFSTLGGDASPSSLAPITAKPIASGCDERSLALLMFEAGRLRLRLCPFGGRCGEVQLPEVVRRANPAGVDLAKLRGTIVLSALAGGVVRVVSSRDEGRSFTPAVVAFDAAEYPELMVGRRPPSRLLALGDRLLLYAGGARPSEAYLLLTSDDQGASFRTP